MTSFDRIPAIMALLYHKFVIKHTIIYKPIESMSFWCIHLGADGFECEDSLLQEK